MLRLFDLTLAVAGLILTSPLLVILMIVGLFDTGSPMFRQTRVGRNKKPFTLLKFRTMRPETAHVATHLADASAVTALGKFLRRTKLDELPQLWNVLKGDMSLVGPRPLLMHYLPRYSKEQARRHEVKPGITGWAQINGFRGETDTLDKMEKRVELDLYYIERMSLWLDLKIIVLTVVKGFVNRNAY